MERRNIRSGATSKTGAAALSDEHPGSSNSPTPPSALCHTSLVWPRRTDTGRSHGKCWR